ncbi:DUF4333 domain-containing protein [Nocardia sp. NPDC051030]|uniref:DUF4333 domain-containing protein n=1 Tax=Nocardia sp. NPDC051030 TaxID=3155162 RepID=UPI0034232CC6
MIPTSPRGWFATALTTGFAVLQVAVGTAAHADLHPAIDMVPTQPLIVHPIAADVLNPTAVERGITQILIDSYGIQNVSNVRCPSPMEVVPGATYTCALEISGEAKTVTIKVTDLDGTYEVGRPT